MWPSPRVPSAPLPARPPQAFLAQQQQPATPHAPTDLVGQWAAPPLLAGQWAAPPPRFYNPLAGLPSWDQQSLASTFSTMTLNQPQQISVVLRLKCYFSRLPTTVLFHILFPRGILLLVQLLSVMGLYFLLHPLVILILHLIFVLLMCWSHHNSLRITFLFVSLPLIIIVLLSLTRMAVL